MTPLLPPPNTTTTNPPPPPPPPARVLNSAVCVVVIRSDWVPREGRGLFRLASLLLRRAYVRLCCVARRPAECQSALSPASLGLSRWGQQTGEQQRPGAKTGINAGVEPPSRCFCVSARLFQVVLVCEMKHDQLSLLLRVVIFFESSNQHTLVRETPNLVQLQMVIYWFSFIAPSGMLLVRKP